jgi:hypothetical protein
MPALPQVEVYRPTSEGPKEWTDGWKGLAVENLGVGDYEDVDGLRGWIGLGSDMSDTDQ